MTKRAPFKLFLPLLLSTCFWFSTDSFASETVLYSEDFEANNGGYTHVGVVDQWEWGTPVFGEGVFPHSGSRVWGTDLDARLAWRHDGKLHSPAISLPAITATQRIYVSFYGLIKLDSMSDRGMFYVSRDGTAWEEVARNFYTMEMGYDGSGNPREAGQAVWMKYIYDVSKYAGGPLYLQFQCIEPEGADRWYYAAPHDMAGWYIDDVSVVLRDGVTRDVKLTLEGWEDPSTRSSCPWLVYSDGTKQVKENDIYSTARMPENEYVDYLVVEHASPVDEGGVCRLRIAELGEEHSQTDRAALMVLDHAVDVRVGCDGQGRVYSYRTPVAPQRAVDNSGNDVLAALAGSDDRGCAMYNEDDVDLDFGNVGLRGAAKLVVRAKGFVTDFTRRNAQINLPERNGIFVQTRDANLEWRTRGRIEPRENWATQVVDLSSFLPDPAGQNLVRIHATSCRTDKYHEIDWTGLDTSGAAPVDAVVLEPTAAVHSTRGDVLSAVRSSDDVRVATDSGEEIALEFAVPPRTLGARDFVFISEGFYVPAPNTYFVYTWDGSNWVQRDGYSYNSPMRTDMSHVFDLSLFLPDPDGQNKVRIWQDYRYEEAEIDYVGLNVDGTNQPLLSAHNYEKLPQSGTADCLAQLSSSDDNRLVFYPYSMGVRGRTRIVEARWPDGCTSVPEVRNLDVGGSENIYDITDPTPPIAWDYFDAAGHPQQEYAVEVWTQTGGAGENLWNYSAASSQTSVDYAGSALVPGETYFARVRVRDNENCWSAWSEMMFRMYCGDCTPPRIVRTPETIALSSTSQTEGLPLAIKAWITDNVAVQSAVLYYRTTGTPNYATTPMVTVADSLYQASIPAGTVLPPGVDYYIWASDGTSGATSPLTNPAASPHQIPVVPNEAPVIVHTPVTSAPCGNAIPIQATITDVTDNVAEAKLHYRAGGEFLYTIVDMVKSGNVYSASIPVSLTDGLTVEYYISARDNRGVTSYSGTFDSPHVIALTGSCNTAPFVTDLTVSPGDTCNVTDAHPTLGWTYRDGEGSPQASYEVEVWSGRGRTGARLWNPPVATEVTTLVVYAGSDLQQGNCYFFCVRASDGSIWSPWAEMRFCLGEGNCPSEPKCELMCDSLVGYPGESVTVAVRLQSSPLAVDAFGFDLSYDSTALRFVSAAACSLTAGSGWVRVDGRVIGTDMLRIGGYGQVAIPVGSSGPVACLTFEVLGPCAGGERVLHPNNLIDDFANFAVCDGKFRCCPSDGDVNGDGHLSPDDARCAFAIYLNGGVVPPGSDCDVAGDCEASRADVNCCGGVTPGDALAIFERWLSGNDTPENCFAPCLTVAMKSGEGPYRIDVAHLETLGSGLVAVPVMMEAQAGRLAFGAEIHFDAAAVSFARFEAAGVAKRWQGLGARQVRPGTVIVGGFDAYGLDAASLADQSADTPITIGRLVFQKKAGEFALGVDWKEQILGSATRPHEADAGRGVTRVQMSAPYPNPQHGGGAVSVSLAIPSGQPHGVVVKVLDVQGRLVRTVLNTSLGGGIHTATWDRTDVKGRRVATGIYLLQLKSGDTVQTRKVVVLD